MREHTYPCTTYICLPLVKYKTKKGVKKSKKGQDSDVYRDPSHLEYVDALQGSQASKRSSSKASSSQLSSKCSRHLDLSQFPISCMTTLKIL